MEHIELDYYYGIESEQFAFFRIPKLLMTDSRYKVLSVNAKMLYGLMLDRMSLSRRNNWIDEEQKVYIIYSVEEAAGELGCSKPTAVKAMSELKEIGLIEKKRRGQGCPDHIYVMNFTTLSMENEKKNLDSADGTESEKVQNSKNLTSENISENDSNVPLNGQVESYTIDANKKAGEMRDDNKENNDNEDSLNDSQNLKYLNSKNLNLKNFTSGNKVFSPLEEKNFAPNNIEKSNNSNHINQRKNRRMPETSDDMDSMDETAKYMQIIRENIEYDIYMQDEKWRNREMFEELYQIICDVVCVPRKTIRISGEEYPYELVKGKFLKLRASHLEYVILCMERNTTKVGNIKSYLITALYNAPNTIKHYFNAEVNHDLYGT